MNEYVITEALRNALINYLAQRPYAEVHAAVAALQGLQAVQTQSPCSAM